VTIRVIVLGNTGMLGHTVVEVLSRELTLEVKAVRRSQLNALEPTLDMIHDVDYVINCIGIIKQNKFAPRREMFMVNAIFPWLLQAQCTHVGAKLIHVTSDCVFSGRVGGYSENDTPDAEDDYGLSKACGEPRNAMVIRTSIIGHELRGKLSLLEWVMSQRGQTIEGYTNHVWNGVTTRVLARAFRDIIVGDLYQPGTFHVHAPHVITKHDLICLINEAWDLGLTIIPTITPVKCDRSLVTVKSLNAKLNVPSMVEMMNELVDLEQSY